MLGDSLPGVDAMRGSDERSGSLFSYVDLEARVRWDHQVGASVDRARVAALAPSISPLLKIHGCWSDPPSTVWAAGQIAAEPIKTRIEECGLWLCNRLLDRDLVIVGYNLPQEAPQAFSAAVADVFPAFDERPSLKRFKPPFRPRRVAGTVSMPSTSVVPGPGLGHFSIECVSGSDRG